jgi:plastocyanin
MARGACLSSVVVLSMLALCCPVALGANVTVQTTSSNTFDSNSVVITQGDTVTWDNTTGFHNVHFDDQLFTMPDPPMPAPWSVFRKFDQPGTYTYYCEVHQTVGMTGTVVVNPSPPAGGGGGGTPGPGPAPVDTAPISSLIGSSKQRVGKLYVRASMNEPGTLTATGTVGVPGGAAKVFRFKAVSRQVSANVPVRLRLKLPRRALKAVKRALARRKKLRAIITLTAKDATGHQAVRKQTIRLTR